MSKNPLPKCDKCPCFIAPDPTNPGETICIKPPNNNLYSNCQSSVKIPVNIHVISSECSCNSDISMNQICLRFCRKNKPETKEDKTGEHTPKSEYHPPKPDGHKTKSEDTGNQTSTVAVVDTKTQSYDHDSEELLKQLYSSVKPGGFCSCNPPGGCNTNTIIIPRERVGDGSNCLEAIIKSEMKHQSRNLADVFNEVQKLRREFREVKDSLDVAMRALRENFPIKSFNKLQDEFKPKNLERKSNSLSMKDSEPEARKVQTTTVTASTEDKKKKGIFSWCF